MKKLDESSSFYDEAINLIDLDDYIGAIKFIKKNIDSLESQDDIALANFTDFLINKVAAQIREDYSALFRGLLMKIADSDILDKDKLLTESTLTFNRILVAEVANGVPISEAKRSAFNIVMSKVADYVD